MGTPSPKHVGLVFALGYTACQLVAVVASAQILAPLDVSPPISDSREEVFIYYANESVHQPARDTMLRWLRTEPWEPERLSLACLRAYGLEGDIQTFQETVDKEIETIKENLRCHRVGRAVNVVFLTNRLVTQGKVEVFRSGSDSVSTEQYELPEFTVERPFLRDDTKWRLDELSYLPIVRTQPLTNPYVLTDLMLFVSKLFPPDKYRSVLLIKSHGGKQQALVSKTLRDPTHGSMVYYVEGRFFESHVEKLGKTSAAEPACGWRWKKNAPTNFELEDRQNRRPQWLLPDVYKEDLFWRLLGSDMRFDGVFLEACDSVLPSDFVFNFYKSLEEKIGYVFYTGCRGTAYANVDYDKVMKSVNGGQPFSAAFRAALQSQHEQQTSEIDEFETAFAPLVRSVEWEGRAVVDFSPGAVDRESEIMIKCGPRPIAESDLDKLAGLGRVGRLELRIRDGTGARMELTPGMRAAISKMSHLETLVADRVDTENDFKWLVDLANLEFLSLTQTTFSNADLAHLSRMENLQALSIADTCVSGEGLKHLRGLSKLEWIDLRFNKLDEETLGHLAELPNLKWVYYYARSDEAVKQLSKIEKLEVAFIKRRQALRHLETDSLRALWLACSGVEDCDLEHIGNLNKLERLVLASVPVSDEACRRIKQLGSLRELDLSNTLIGDNGLGELSGLDKLQRLDVSGTEVTDEGIDRLAKHTGLRFLDCSSTRTTMRGVKALKGQMANCVVVWSQSPLKQYR